MRVADLSMLRRHLIVAAIAATAPTPPAIAAYGEFAKMAAQPGSDFSAGDSNNECLFAQPGTGVCTVYKSSAPQLWATPDTDKALGKLLAAAASLGELEAFIQKSQWTAISQALGASRDLREAVSFLTAKAESKDAASQAKRVFQALDGISLAAQKKDKATAQIYFDKFEAAMPTLIKLVS